MVLEVFGPSAGGFMPSWLNGLVCCSSSAKIPSSYSLLFFLISLFNSTVAPQRANIFKRKKEKKVFGDRSKLVLD